MIWKALAGIWFALALGVVVLWFSHGTQTLTKDKVQIITKRMNPTFGVEEEIVEWKPQLRLGLDYGAPAFALFCGIGVVCVRIGKHRQ
jgi:hypothetical protein